MNIMNHKKLLKKTEYFNPVNTASADDMSTRLCRLLKMLNQSDRDTVILCIGTDRATGDALGPLVGSMLSASSCSYKIYGTLQHPVHALNLNDTINRIYSEYADPIVIAIDASLGHRSDVGMVTLSRSPLLPGIGVNKKLPAIGDLSITGIVNLSGKPGLSLLQSTRLYTVSNMAHYISNVITKSEQSLRFQRG